WTLKYVVMSSSPLEGSQRGATVSDLDAVRQVVITPRGIATSAAATPGTRPQASSSPLEGSQHPGGEPCFPTRTLVVISPRGIATDPGGHRLMCGDRSSSALEGSHLLGPVAGSLPDSSRHPPLRGAGRGCLPQQRITQTDQLKIG